jgi:hypothetical protein
LIAPRLDGRGRSKPAPSAGASGGQSDAR